MIMGARPRGATRTTLIAAALIAVAGCDAHSDNGGGSSALKSTMTQAQANQKLDEHIRRATDQIPEASLTTRLEITDMPCTDPNDQGPSGRVVAQRDYELAGIDPARIPTYFDKLKKWWETNNFRILDDRKKYERLSVENRTDSIGIVLEASKGHLFIVGSSPCVWPNGTPEPS